MVRPPKPDDVKQNNPVRKSILKTLKSDIEERYRTEAPVHKKNISNKLNIPSSVPGSSLQSKVKVKTTSTSPKTKPLSPNKSNLSKTQSQQPATIIKRDSIAQSKSNTNEPGSPILKTRGKTRKASITKKKSSVGAKSSPMNRLLKITEIEDPDRTSLPLGEQFISNEGKTRNKLNKLGKVVSGAKKVTKKSPVRDAPKTMGFNLKQEESGASLTTHFPLSFIPNELNPTPNISAKFGSGKKRKTSMIHKKTSKSKADQEDNTKDTKNKTKSKLHTSKLLDRTLSSDSVPVISVREIKHNDSFVISARKLQKSTRQRRDTKPDCLKLTERTSFTRAKTDNFPLKSCLKKTGEVEKKIGETFKLEGKMRLHETLHPTQII